jgi:HSF-type DNA-binding
MMCETTSLALATKDAAKEQEKLKTKMSQDIEDKSKQQDEEQAQTAPTVVQPFRDCSQDPIYKTLPETSKSNRGGAGGMGHFPTILHILLGRAESSNYDDVVSWRPHGRCFVVYDRSLFVQHIMPMYFRQTQFPR